MNIKIIAGLIFAIAIIMSGISVSANYNFDKRVDNIDDASTCNGDCANKESGTCPYANQEGGCQKEGSTCGGTGDGTCPHANQESGSKGSCLLH